MTLKPASYSVLGGVPVLRMMRGKNGLPSTRRCLPSSCTASTPAVGDWLAGPGVPDNRVGGRLEILHGAYFEIVDPDLRIALAAPDVQHELIDVGVGADYVAFKFGAHQLQLLAQPFLWLTQRQLLPAAGDLVIVAPDERR